MDKPKELDELDKPKESLLSPRAGLALSGGISDQTRRRLIAAGKYPPPIVLSRNRHGRPVRVAWIESQVREWVAKQIRVARGESEGEPPARGKGSANSAA